MRFISMICIGAVFLSLTGCDIGHGYSHDTATPASLHAPKPDHHQSID